MSTTQDTVRGYTSEHPVWQLFVELPYEIQDTICRALHRAGKAAFRGTCQLARAIVDRNVTSLGIRGSPITGDRLDNLHVQFPAVRNLRLSCQMSTGQLPQLFNRNAPMMQRLEGLGLYIEVPPSETLATQGFKFLPLNPATLKMLVDFCPALRHLDLPDDSQRNLGVEGLKTIAKLSRLEALHISSSWLKFVPTPIAAASLGVISSLTALTQLQIHGPSGINDDSLEVLSCLTRLQSLTIFNCKSINGHGLAAARELPSLTYLELDGIQVMDASSVRAIAGLQRLHGLDLCVSFQGDLLSSWAMEQLATLSVLGCLRLSANHKRTLVQSVELLGSLTGLTELSLASCKVETAQQLTALHALHTLDVYMLHSMTQQPERLSHSFRQVLSALPSLRKLIISSEQLLQEADAPCDLPQVTDLQVLDVGADLHDLRRAFLPFTGLRSLRLVFCENPLAGVLQELAVACPRLHKLYLNHLPKFMPQHAEHARHVHTLHVEACGELPPAILHTLTQPPSQVQHLVLRHCRGVGPADCAAEVLSSGRPELDIRCNGVSYPGLA